MGQTSCTLLAKDLDIDEWHNYEYRSEDDPLQYVSSLLNQWLSILHIAEQMQKN